MPAHRIAVTTRAQDLPKAGAGVDLIIRQNGKVQGRLALGRGGGALSRRPGPCSFRRRVLAFQLLNSERDVSRFRS